MAAQGTAALELNEMLFSDASVTVFAIMDGASVARPYRDATSARSRAHPPVPWWVGTGHG
jgi:hypothetical protein